MGKFNLADHIQAAQPPQVRDIEAITAEILDAKRAGGEAILTIGRGLIEAKALLSHGEWLPWLNEAGGVFGKGRAKVHAFGSEILKSDNVVGFGSIQSTDFVGNTG